MLRYQTSLIGIDSFSKQCLKNWPEYVIITSLCVDCLVILLLTTLRYKPLHPFCQTYMYKFMFLDEILPKSRVGQFTYSLIWSQLFKEVGFYFYCFMT